jgi:hypothetical protein
MGDNRICLLANLLNAVLIVLNHCKHKEVGDQTLEQKDHTMHFSVLRVALQLPSEKHSDIRNNAPEHEQQNSMTPVNEITPAC